MTPEMKALLEAMRDDPGSISPLAAAGAARAALTEIERLRAVIAQANNVYRHEFAASVLLLRLDGDALVDLILNDFCGEKHLPGLARDTRVFCHLAKPISKISQVFNRIGSLHLIRSF